VQIGVLPDATRRVMRDAAPQSMTDVTDIRQHLCVLIEERALARECGLTGDPAYMADLEDEIATTEAAYTGQVVTEIARLRADLCGALWG
jgi:hypothetical protein